MGKNNTNNNDNVNFNSPNNQHYNNLINNNKKRPRADNMEDQEHIKKELKELKNTINKQKKKN